MILIAYIVVAFTFAQLIVALVNLLIETNLPISHESNDEPVSVLIPARNEEMNIRNILDDLIRQNYRNLEIIVFNDQSHDLTAAIVTEYTISDKRIDLINSGGLPDGWLGKNYACHTLSQKASGKYLLYLDADVRVGPDLIERAVFFSKKHNLGLISIFPKQIIRTTGERITVPNMNYILVSLLPLVLVRKSGYPSLSAANGQFMFFRADEYNKLLPHQKVRSDKVEDISIARMYKSNRIKTACLLGDDSITCRMYTGFRGAAAGFSKNVIAFFGNSLSLAVIFWLITTLGFIPVLLSFPPLILATYLSAYILARIIISAASRQNLFYNLLFIIPLQISLGLFIYKAFVNKKYGKFEWKGRSID